MILGLKQKDFKGALGFVLLSQLAGILGSLFTAGSVSDWYTTLVRPALSPPNWVFGPVWITLYTLMGLAAYLVYKKQKKNLYAPALKLFYIQLALNALWSIIFFGMNNIRLALAEILVLWSLIAMTMKAFYDIDKRAGYLFVPYILWVTFATYLNYMFWMLN